MILSYDVECYYCNETIFAGEEVMRFRATTNMLYFHNAPIINRAHYNDFRHTAEYRRIVQSRRKW